MHLSTHVSIEWKVLTIWTCWQSVQPFWLEKETEFLSSIAALPKGFVFLWKANFRPRTPNIACLKMQATHLSKPVLYEYFCHCVKLPRTLHTRKDVLQKCRRFSSTAHKTVQHFYGSTIVDFFARFIPQKFELTVCTYQHHLYMLHVGTSSFPKSGTTQYFLFH